MTVPAVAVQAQQVAAGGQMNITHTQMWKRIGRRQNRRNLQVCNTIQEEKSLQFHILSMQVRPLACYQCFCTVFCKNIQPP